MNRSVRLYIALSSAVLWLGLAAAALAGNLDALTHPARLAPLLGMVVAVEAVVVRARNRGRADLQSFSTTAHIAAAIIFGPAVAAFLAAVGVVVVDGGQGAPRRVVLMNSAMFGCSIWVAGIVFELTGGSVGTIGSGDFVPLVLLIVVRLSVNEVMLGAVVALDSGARFTDLMRDQIRGALGSELGQGCLGVLVAYFYTTSAWVILPFLAPLLVVVYRSEANFERLKSETADALHQMASVIDLRDRNTADHTRRVAEYVERFTDAITLRDREAERLVEAARYHDLGKITVDVATLSKAGRLDEGELRAIRRHPRLSARLLAPFHFAQKIALYAELHHERYDGRGYYGVSPTDIPIEAHVLIVADSFDAMTSERAYRPGLSIEDAISEVRANAGTQFHPLVAAAFAAMLEGTDVREALGDDHFTALRADFSTIPVVDISWLRALRTPTAITVVLASACLVMIGIHGVPSSVTRVLAAATVALGTVAVTQSTRQRRRRMRILAAIRRTESAGVALAAGGIVGWVAWLTPDEEPDTYRPIPLIPPEDGADLATAISQALRPTINTANIRLPSGGHLTISAPNTSQARLAVGTATRLGHSDIELIELVAAEATAPSTSEPIVQAVVTSERRHQTALEVGVILLDLGIFDEVRHAAGQLYAERIVLDAVRIVERLLRDEDRIVRVADDRVGLVVAVANEQQLDAICSRIKAGLGHIQVPRGAAKPTPQMRAALTPAALSDRALAEVIAAVGTVERRAAS
jgi:hypothetical protein